MRVIGGTVPEPGNLIWVLVYLPRDDLAPAEFFMLTSSDLHTLLKPVQDAWLKKCQEQHEGPMPGVYGVRRGEVVIMSTPSTTIAAANGWDRPLCALATRSSPSAASATAWPAAMTAPGFSKLIPGGNRPGPCTIDGIERTVGAKTGAAWRPGKRRTFGWIWRASAARRNAGDRAAAGSRRLRAEPSALGTANAMRRRRRTKVVATLGPASSDRVTIERLFA